MRHVPAAHIAACSSLWPSTIRTALTCPEPRRNRIRSSEWAASAGSAAPADRPCGTARCMTGRGTRRPGLFEDLKGAPMKIEFFADMCPSGYALGGDHRKLTTEETLALFAPNEGEDVVTKYDDAWVAREEAKRAMDGRDGALCAGRRACVLRGGACGEYRRQEVPRGGRKRDQGAEGGLAPGCGGCGWQDRRRGGHSCADSGAILLRSGAAHRPRPRARKS